MTRAILALAFLMGTAAAGAHPGRRIIVALSSDLSPYQRALDGIQAVVNAEVLKLDADRLDARPGDVVIAVGGRAALETYPNSIHLVYCLAPTVTIPPDQFASVTRVFMGPRPSRIVTAIREIQPAAVRIGVLSGGGAARAYLDADADALGRSDSTLVHAEVGPGPGAGLPSRLRELAGRVDAIWILPDPAIITGANMTVLRDFSWASKVPFYVPMDGLLEKGAVAAISASFEDIGEAAGRAAEAIIAGGVHHSDAFPAGLRVSVNYDAVRETATTIRASGPPPSERVPE